MHNSSRFSGQLGKRWLPGLLGLVLLASTGTASLHAQQSAYGGPSARHYLYDYGMPPGMVAHRKMLAREAMRGYFQPIEFVGPEGSEISVFADGTFQPTSPGQTVAGMMVGSVYRLRVTGVPGHAGKELYPSVEIIGRLFPPQGQEVKCAIPVHIPLADLLPALDGKLVTRVIYLENPRTAIPEQRTPADQPFFDIGVGEDPLRVAEKFGRPMVIVRIGSRVPEQDELDGFGFGAPPLMWFESAMNEINPNNDPFERGPLESLPPGVIDEASGTTGQSAVRQVAYWEPVLPDEPQDPEPAPAPHVPVPARQGVAPAPQQPAPVAGYQQPTLETPAPDQSMGAETAVQSWSLDDKGVQNNTGLDNGIVLASAAEPQPAMQPPAPRLVTGPPPASGIITGPPPAIQPQGSPQIQVEAEQSVVVPQVETQETPEPFVEPEESVVPMLPAEQAFANAVPMCQPWPDELLLDGGDRDFQSVIRDTGQAWRIDGLDAEDTIAHFDTLDGQRVIEPSNRVAIYAPRFAAVRKIDGLGRTRYANLTSRLGDETELASSQHTDFSSTTLQNLQPGRHQRNLLASGLENREGGVVAEQMTLIRGFDGRLKTFENLRLVRTGVFDNREKGRLAIAMQRAAAWETTMSAQTTVDKTTILIANNVDEARETVHIRTETNSQLRLVKLASTDVAKPGDYVDFTIRFDNVGALPIGNVTVLDNLTPRLDYVPGSAECSMPARFIAEPNREGSQTLRWEIEAPVDPATGGIIRFQCRVR